MTSRGNWLDIKRARAQAFGIRLREDLVERYMNDHRLRERPFLKDVVDDLIEEVQGARLREEVLLTDRFAQTEAVGGRLIVTINTRIAEIEGMKDPAGVANVAKWHESVHIERDMDFFSSHPKRFQPSLPGFGVQTPKLVVCRGILALTPQTADREFFAENAGVAAAIAGADLARCAPFLQFSRLATEGGDLGSLGWSLLYKTAELIGVNITALSKYFQQRGLFRIEQEEGRRRVIAAPQLFGGLEWL
jgi:hypothetical protein